MLSVCYGMLTDEMTRHTTFKFCLDPTVKLRCWPGMRGRQGLRLTNAYGW